MTGMMVLVLLAVGGYFLFAKGNNAPKNAAVKNEDKKTETAVVPQIAVSAGSYEVYDPAKLAKAKDGKVLLFFRASWCPSCKALDGDIRANLNNIPKDVTILDVDYDKYTDLKKKYGVVMQHTIVQVDEQGNQIEKWSASPTLASLVNSIK